MSELLCLMNTGKHRIDDDLADVLLCNAYDMCLEKRRVQRIKSRTYDGIIETNLETHEFNGSPVMEFLAHVSTSTWETSEIRYLIRTDEMHLTGEWHEARHITGPIPVPPGMDPHEFVRQLLDEWFKEN